MAFVALTMTVVICQPTMASSKEVSIEEGTYYIKAANGNAKGQVLFWTKGSDENALQFESCGGSHADYEVWYITDHRYYKGAYSIYAYNVNTKVVSKNREQIKIKNLKRNTTYYIRARYTTAKGVTSRWSKTGSFTTRKE